MKQHGNNYFAPTPDPADQKMQNMVANILPADPPPPPPPTTLGGWGQKVKIHFFQNMVMLHIKLNAITKCSNMAANTLPATPPPPDPRGQKLKLQLFQNNFMLHIKL